jgi:hypothetical protein
VREEAKQRAKGRQNERDHLFEESRFARFACAKQQQLDDLLVFVLRFVHLAVQLFIGFALESGRGRGGRRGGGAAAPHFIVQYTTNKEQQTGQFRRMRG